MTPPADKRDKKRDKDKDDEREELRRGSIEPTDPDLAVWINKLWTNGEAPQSLQVVQLYQRGKVLGEVVEREDFPNRPQMNMERASILANQFVGAAQLDCDKVVKRPQSYGVLAYDKARGAGHLKRYPLDLAPRTGYLVRSGAGKGTGQDDEDDEESGLDPKRLALEYVKRQIDASQWDKDHYARVFGDLFLLFGKEVQEQRNWISDLMGQNKQLFVEVMEAIRQREAALSTALDREVTREITKFKIGLLKEGVRTGRNLLHMLFGEVAAEKGLSTRSEEQGAVDDFLRDCEETGISVKLFGDWTRGEGGDTLTLVRRGIFAPQQFELLVKVRDGQLPPEALDELEPGSGKECAVTEKQIAEAQPLMSESVQTSFMRILHTRQRKRRAVEQPAETKPSQDNTAPSSTTQG